MLEQIKNHAPIVNCSLTSSGKGAILRFLVNYYNYTSPSGPTQTLTGDPVGSGKESLLGIEYETIAKCSWKQNEVVTIRRYTLLCGGSNKKHSDLLIDGGKESDPWFDQIFKYTHYYDIPFNYSFKLFDQIFSNSKFILTERDPKDWYLNVFGYWKNRMEKVGWVNPVLNDFWEFRKIPPIIQQGGGKAIREHAQLIKSSIDKANMFEGLNGAPCLDFQGYEFNEDVNTVRAQALMEFYVRYNHKVKQYFKNKPNKLLLLTTPIEFDQYKSIADFIGRPMPDKPKEHWKYNPVTDNTANE